MTDKIKFLFVTAISIVFVVTTLLAIFGGGRVLDSVLKNYVLKVETCEYVNQPREVVIENPKVVNITIEKNCSIDYNRAKADIAGGLAMFLVAAPIAGFTFLRGKKYL